MCRYTRSVMRFMAVSFLLCNLPTGIDAQDDCDAASKSDPEIRVVPDVNQPITLDQGSSLNPKLLQIARDGERESSSEEREVYLKSLKLASETPVSALREAAAKFQEERRRSNSKYANVDVDHFPQFYDLFENPDAYRGRAVSLRGTLRRLTQSDVGQNLHGIGTIYEGWLYTADSQSNPIVVVFTEKPAGLKLGADITEEVRATGYFFKVYGYEAQNGPGTAPMLLAGTIELNPGPRHYVFEPLSPAVYVVLTLGFIVLGYGIWKSSRPKRLESLLPPEEPKL